MKAIIGVDGGSEYKPALHLYQNLNFQPSETILVHASSAVMPFAPMDYQAAVAAQHEFMQAAERLGHQALDEAKTLASSLGLECSARLIPGSPGGVLLSEAEASVDLVAVCATHSGQWSTSFLGSVSKSLTIACKSSVLVAKGHVVSQKPIRVVLATDHSEYASKWIEKFLSFNATGFSEIHVVTAIDLEDWQTRPLTMNLPEYAADLGGWLKEKARELNDALVFKLGEFGYQADARVMEAPPNDAIREAMQDTGADLLVMGAQGHGFLERLLIGSVALHQVMVEPYPVLVVRPSLEDSK